MSSTKEKATAFAASYGAASELSLNPSSTIQEVASAIASHYTTSPPFTIFSLGTTTTLPSDPTPGVQAHLQLLEDSGLGYRVRFVKSEVQVVSEGIGGAGGSALCWITWAIEPKKVDGKGEEGWEFTNVYGYREDAKVEKGGRWEFTIADQEVEGLLKRRPEMYGQR